MKMPIKWHKECLRNMMATAYERSAVSERAISEEKKIWNEVKILKEQIVKAEIQGKDGFDADRFMRGK
jgi:hypothetical protein